MNRAIVTSKNDKNYLQNFWHNYSSTYDGPEHFSISESVLYLYLENYCFKKLNFINNNNNKLIKISYKNMH